MSGTRFTATESDGQGLVVTLVASAPFVRLAGTWKGNTGTTGTFDYARR